jgi:hypothetical protein
MKIAKDIASPLIDQLALGIKEWQQRNSYKKNIPVPDDLRAKIRSLKGLHRPLDIAPLIGLHRTTIANIMKEGSGRPKGKKTTSKRGNPKVIKLAPIQICHQKFDGGQILEMESPQGWKLKFSGQLDLSMIIKTLVEVRV